MIRLFNRYWALPARCRWSSRACCCWRRSARDPGPASGIGPGTPPPDSTVLLDAWTFAIIGLLCLYANGLYDFGERLSSRELLIRLLRTFSILAVASWALYFVVPDAADGPRRLRPGAGLRRVLRARLARACCAGSCAPRGSPSGC